ncbi:MAG: DUF1835 domain-containing protein [Lentisphaeria bacterium]|nr:DUF1835 domain-containing protein [Lentisphaeria bacterium]
MNDHPADLHILNGDCALELWKQCGFSGQSLVWRETYLEGPLPETDDLEAFRAARAEYLSHFAELDGIGPERLANYLRKLDDSVLDLPEASDLTLWFDSCIFDQTLLMRILYLLDRKKNPSGRVFLFCCEGNVLSLDDFRQGDAEKVRLFPSDLETGARAWRFFQRKDAAGLLRLAETGNFERMPKLKKALIRCAEEVQEDENGLNRTRRQILQLVASGCRSFQAIFKGLAALEEYPFLGDTACQRLLDDLVRRGLLELGPEGYRLTREGTGLTDAS